jgi:hypothetical protein
MRLRWAGGDQRTNIYGWEPDNDCCTASKSAKIARLTEWQQVVAKR